MVNGQGQGQQQPQVIPISEKLQETLAQGYIHKATSDLHRWILELEDMVKRLENNLLGMEFDFKEKKYLQKREALMNQKGVDIIIALLRPALDRSKQLSWWTEEDVMNNSKAFEKNMSRLLHIKHKEFKLDPALITLVREMLGNAVHTIYRSGFQGGMRNFFKDTETRTEMISHVQGQQKKGLFGKVGNLFS